MQKRGTFNEEPAARMLFCLAEPFFEPAAQVEPTCLYTILPIRTPISTAVGENALGCSSNSIKKNAALLLRIPVRKCKKHKKEKKQYVLHATL